MPRIILLAGPTASGKSDLSLSLARACAGEIINADSAQIYTELKIGTAKPDWRKSDIPHHLFDIRSTPENYSAASFREDVLALSTDMDARDVQPLVVGGSLFYHKSLLFPPLEPLPQIRDSVPSYEHMSDSKVYEELVSIDPVRASHIHPNDRYRVERALDIWHLYGVLPSQRVPAFDPPCDIDIIFLKPDRALLTERIAKRTKVMIETEGWLDEARALYKDNEWRAFIETKKFIGYPEIFAWIEGGEKDSQLPALVERIVFNTRSYAKRQETFWRSFLEQVSAFKATSSARCRTLIITDLKTAHDAAYQFLLNGTDDSVAK